MILAERAARLSAEARADTARANADAAIAHLRLEIEKLRRALYGVRSERKARLLEQLELQLEELETAAAEDELLAEKAAAKTRGAPRLQRKRPSRKPFPAHLPRERVVIPAPACCPSCGSTKLSKLGEDVTETLEVVPAGRSSRPCARSSPAGAARRLRSRRRRFMQRLAVLPGPTFWP